MEERVEGERGGATVWGERGGATVWRKRRGGGGPRYGNFEFSRRKKN